MLWYKTWVDTRLRFLVGLALLTCGAALIVGSFPRVTALLDSMSIDKMSGPVGDRLRESLELGRTFGGYIATQWFVKTPVQLGTLFALLLGSGGLISRGSGGPLFMLSLPVSRARLVAVRAALGVAELFVLSFVPSLVIVLAAPAIGQSYPFSHALVYGASLFTGTTVFFALALAASTVWDDLWRPLLLAGVLAVAVATLEGMSVTFARVGGIFTMMAGTTFFSSGQIPWIGWTASALASAAIIWAAARNFTAREF